MNKWNIPEWLEEEIRTRDTQCVYCGVAFNPHSLSRKDTPTWEHIINNAIIVTRENIALCCFSCNSSKGTKKLSAWLKSNYCKKKNINFETVADVVKNALMKELDKEKDPNGTGVE